MQEALARTSYWIGSETLNEAILIMKLGLGFALISAIACAGRSHGQLLPDTDATIIGKVFDDYYNRPLAGALVDVEGTNASGRTDSSGNFRIYAVPPGDHVIRTRRIGFYPSSSAMLLQMGKTYLVEIGLDAGMVCLDECEDHEPLPTPGRFRVISVNRSPAVANAMFLFWCDSGPMKPAGRVVKIPPAPKPPAGYGTLVGSVSQAETGDAVSNSGVALVPAEPKAKSRTERASDSYGGFAFTSVVPGKYELRVRSIGLIAQSRMIRISANQSDTVKLSLKTYRCHGY